MAATSSPGGVHSVIRNELARKTSRRPHAAGARPREPSDKDLPTGRHRIQKWRVEARIRVADRLGVTVDEFENETMLALEAPRRSELR